MSPDRYSKGDPPATYGNGHLVLSGKARSLHCGAPFRITPGRIRRGVGLGLTVIALVTITSCSGGVDTSSISYRDGHQIGSINYNPLEPSTSDWYTKFCHQLVPHGMPASDNESDWVAGCIAGMGQAAFGAQHPGANSGGTGSTGATGNTGNT